MAEACLIDESAQSISGRASSFWMIAMFNIFQYSSITRLRSKTTLAWCVMTCIGVQNRILCVIWGVQSLLAFSVIPRYHSCHPWAEPSPSSLEPDKCWLEIPNFQRCWNYLLCSVAVVVNFSRDPASRLLDEESWPCAVFLEFLSSPPEPVKWARCKGKCKCKCSLASILGLSSTVKGIPFS